ncbi:MAG: rod-binding protein [Opitutaceae bacterium]|jgi:Rod binding domain-containing protein|nr:rod-binding protein [Opitutaceae bacterium]
MSVSAISASSAQPAWAKALDAPLGLSSATRTVAGRTSTPAEVKKAAAQFEAIILRQLLTPTIEPIMSGGLGGAGGTGGGVYGYMLTDVLANSLSQGGGMGLSQMLSRQLTPRGSAQPAQGADPAAPTEPSA